MSGNTSAAPIVVPVPTRRHAGWHLLMWSFNFFNSVRLLTYVPTIWAIHQSGQSSQHSIVTWLTWFGANATMAAWLHDQQRCWNKAVIVSAGNAVMCLATLGVIVWYRV